jgi:predicted nucleotide-binding protein
VPVTNVFVGSSAAARSQAKAVIARFAGPALAFLPWWDAFAPGCTLLEDLDAICGTVDAALLLFSPESETTIRGSKVAIPNQNVLFEFGYFSGRLGRGKVAMLKYGEFYLPSDFGGYVHLFGSASFKRGKTVPIGKRTDREFARWIAQI